MMPWRREWLSTPVLLPGKFHGQNSLVGYSPQGHKELDMTERLTLSFHSSLIAIVLAWVSLSPMKNIESVSTASCPESLSFHIFYKK